MAISMDLRVLARKLEKSSDDLLINASTKGPEAFEKVATAIAAASTLLEGVADDMDQSAEFSISPRQLDEIAALATAFDESGDPLLKKQASVLDELLLSIAAPKNAAKDARKVTDDEITRLREKRRGSRREEAYEEPRKAHADMNNAKEQAKAVAQQVKRYRPLEAPLQTRYPPDRPGGQMTRITDHVYQDIVTGIVYDFKAGYTTQKGNEIPGTSVENQTRQLGDARNQSASLFESRQSLMGRYASDGDLYHLKKYAMGNEIAVALKATRDLAPGLLDKAIAQAQQDGMSTSEIGEILSDVASSDEGAQALKALENSSGIQKITAMTEDESANEYEKALALFDAFAAAGWAEMIADHLDAMKMAGMHNKHLSKLEREFLGAEPYQPEGDFEIAPESVEDIEVMPFSKTVMAPRPGDTMFSAANRQGLIGVALGAVQELAPHLLKAAVAKAKADGLTDQQIKSVLASDFNTKFKTASFGEDGEVKAAESLFPQLRAVGWDSLVRDHLKVMARLGVSHNAIQKLAEVKTSSYDELKSILKQAVFSSDFDFIEEPGTPGVPAKAPKAKKPVPQADFEFVDEAPQTVRDPQAGADWDWEEEEPEPATVRLAPKAPATPVAAPVEEEAPHSLLTEMFGETPKPPAVEEPKGPVTPLDDPEEWGKVFNAVKSEIAADQAVKDQIQAFRAEGRKEEGYAFVKQLINERMNAQGFAGAYEKDPSGTDWVTVAEKKGVKTPSPTPMVTGLPTATGPQGKGKTFNWSNYQTLNRMSMSDGDIENLEKRAKEIWTRDAGQYSALMEKFKFTGSEIPASYSSLPTEIKRQLDVLFQRGEGSTAVRSLLEQIVNAYIDEHSEQFLQERISELNGKAEELFEESSKLEASGKSAQAQTKLDMAAKIKEQLSKPEELLANTIKAKKEQLMLTEKDLMAARKGLRSNDKAMATEIRREALTELNKQSINQALQERGLPPMFSGVKVMSLAQFAERLKEVGSINPVALDERGKRILKDEKKSKKKPSLLIHEIPKNKQTGAPMKTLWDDPEFYLETIKEVSEEHPLPEIPRRNTDKKVKEKLLKDRKAAEEVWNNLFEDRGLVGPFRKLFGTGPDWEGTIASTLNLRPEKVDSLQLGDLLANTVVNGKHLKTILTDPDEYANHWLEGKAKFGPEFQWKLDPILEMNQIHGGTPKINAPTKLIEAIRKRMEKGQELDNLKVELMAKGVPENLTESIWNEIKGSGDAIRRRLFGGLAGGAEKILQGRKTPEEIIDDLLNNPRNGIMTQFPDAYIPPGVMQALLKQLIAKLRHNNKVKADWNKWSTDQGFWPPYSRLMGRSTTADLLKGGSGYRNPDPDAVGGTPMAELDLD